MKWILLILLTVASSARADWFVGLGTGVRVKDQSAGTGQALLIPVSLMAGAVWEDWAAALEAVELRQETGGGSTIVATRQLDAIAWLRRGLSRHFWNPYLGIGAGKQRASVETHFNGQVTANQGEATNVLGISVGIQSQVKERLNFGVEFRYLNGSQLRAVTLFESVSRLVYQF